MRSRETEKLPNLATPGPRANAANPPTNKVEESKVEMAGSGQLGGDLGGEREWGARGRSRRFTDGPHLPLRQDAPLSPRPWMAPSQDFGHVLTNPAFGGDRPSRVICCSKVGIEFPNGRAFQVWAPPERLIRVPGQRGRRLGARLGKDADRSRAQRAALLSPKPPGARKAAAREVIEFLRPKEQASFPPGVTTGAQFGFCGGDGSILIRLEGSFARAHSGAKNESAQRAKVGNCPRGTQAWRVAVPPRYEVGASSDDGAHAPHSWCEHGLWPG